VATLIDDYKTQGRYKINVSNRGFAQGIYYYKLDLFSGEGNVSAAKKMIMLR
jgi:hypothetical protein